MKIIMSEIVKYCLWEAILVPKVNFIPLDVHFGLVAAELPAAVTR